MLTLLLLQGLAGQSGICCSPAHIKLQEWQLRTAVRLEKPAHSEIFFHTTVTTAGNGTAILGRETYIGVARLEEKQFICDFEIFPVNYFVCQMTEVLERPSVSSRI